jgi:hypothetical protein
MTDQGHGASASSNGGSSDAMSPTRLSMPSDPEEHRCQRVAAVADQISEQRDRTRRDEQARLQNRRDREDDEARPDGAQPGALSHGRVRFRGGP